MKSGVFFNATKIGQNIAQELLLLELQQKRLPVLMLVGTSVVLPWYRFLVAAEFFQEPVYWNVKSIRDPN